MPGPWREGRPRFSPQPHVTQPSDGTSVVSRRGGQVFAPPCPCSSQHGRTAPVLEKQGSPPLLGSGTACHSFGGQENATEGTALHFRGFVHVSFMSQDISQGDSPCLVLWQRETEQWPNHATALMLPLRCRVCVCHTAKLHSDEQENTSVLWWGRMTLLRGGPDNRISQITHHSDLEVTSLLILPL